MKNCFIKISISLFFALIVILVFTGISCSITPHGIEILTGNYESPKLLSLEITSESEAYITFSKQIKFEKLCIKEIETNSIINFEQKDLKNGAWKINFAKTLSCANIYQIEGNAVDTRGNTLYFKDKFQGFNSRIPKVIINEIRTESSKTKSEFIELKSLESGNLGGMELISAYDGIEKNYILPPAEVKKDEFIVIHMKKMDEDNVDELGDDISLSEGSESIKNARDLWVENIDTRIGKSDVILLKTRVNGKIMDSVLFCESKIEDWKKEFLKECAKLAFESGTWKEGFSAKDAACSDGVTVTRTLSRQSVENGKNCWIVTANGKCTPGAENSKEKYVMNKSEQKRNK
ncbi:MAG: hypothetical protein ACTTHG_05305 [Treponemataceae bacterium]